MNMMPNNYTIRPRFHASTSCMNRIQRLHPHHQTPADGMMRTPMCVNAPSILFIYRLPIRPRPRSQSLQLTVLEIYPNRCRHLHQVPACISHRRTHNDRPEKIDHDHTLRPPLQHLCHNPPCTPRLLTNRHHLHRPIHMKPSNAVITSHHHLVSRMVEAYAVGQCWLMIASRYLVYRL